MSEQPPRHDPDPPSSHHPNPSVSEGQASGGDAPLPGSSSAFMVMVLHLFTFVCCANWIFGPLGVVFAMRAAMSRDRGHHARAETLVRYSWMCLGAGLVMLIVMVILTAVLAAMGLPFLERQSEYIPY